MEKHKSFFSFLAVLVVAGVGFGFYVSTLQSCGSQGSTLPVMECHKLYMAFGVLFAVALMLALGAAFYALVPPPDEKDHPGKQIFDTLAKTLLPIVTLVLGYYFGSTGSGSTPPKEKGAVQQERSVNPAGDAGSAPKPKT